MGTYLLITPKEDKLYHYGIKGMKWHQHKSFGSSSGAATTGMGGGSVEISEEEREIQKNELAAEHLDRLASAMERNGRSNDRSTIFHTLVIRSASAEAKRRAEAGKRKVQEIREYAKKMGLSFQQSDDQDSLTFALDYTPEDLMHFGIKGMKWGIRRFQPYQKGEKVKGGKEIGAATKVKQRPSAGNIIERYKAKKVTKKRVEAAKKAQATRKAKTDFENEKKKAIESGSVEELAKFKGQLTNEEYQRAFTRLQNEKKVADMVAANQKTVWDKIDKGMAIVQKVGGYANTLATAKENFTKLDDALHKKEKEAAKEKATAEKNKFITNIENITELNRGMDKYKLTPQEYQSAMNILANKKLRQGKDNNIDQDFVDQDKKAAKEKAAKEQADRDRWTAEQNFKDFQKRQAKEAKKQAKEAWKQYQKEANAPKDGEWWSDSDSQSSGKTGKTGYRGMKWETREKQETGEQRTSQLLLTMKDNPPSASSADTGKRVINGFKSSSAGTTYQKQADLNFGNSSVKKYSAKPSEPSKIVTDTRKTVADTQAESARQKEVDKKRKKAFGK